MRLKYYILLLFITNNVFAEITCSNPVEICVEGGGTRDFNGASIYLPCWKYKTTYTCKAKSDNNCKKLAADGCSPATTTCKVKWGNICAVQEVTYDCPTRFCNGTEIVCNNGGDGFCLTGDCASQTRVADTDMQRSLSALSALAEAGKDFEKNMTIFKGESSECSNNIAGFKNCCVNSGWGQKVGLAECSSDEEKLAKKKAAGLAAEVGTYCYNKVLGKCTSEHTTYCIFGSKLGRIIRVAANRQLGLSFGDPEHADCRGLTPEEFQLLDFSKIDFSEFYKDLESKTKVKLADTVNPAIQQKLGGLKDKLQDKAQSTKARADELRVRT